MKHVPYTAYRMRAECQTDLQSLFPVIPFNTITMVQCAAGLPDVDVQFTSRFTLKQVRDALRQVIDGHVMLETVNYAHLYDGERREC